MKVIVGVYRNNKCLVEKATQMEGYAAKRAIGVVRNASGLGQK